VWKETGRGKDRFKIRDLADARCTSSQAVLDLLSTIDVGRRVPSLAGDDAPSEESE
jgi:hypothetical protein